jgi:DNA-binding XRE family transcriptional regulator
VLESGQYLPQLGSHRESEAMSKPTYPLKLPLSIKKAAQRLAKEDGVSLNQWIAAVVAEKVGVAQTATEFFNGPARGATVTGLMKSLSEAPKVAPGREEATRLDKKEQDALAKRLWTLRRSRKWTQSRMAAAIGISRTRLAHAERGRFAGERSQSMFLIRKILENAE